jgi:hypothetical protein
MILTSIGTTLALLFLWMGCRSLITLSLWLALVATLLFSCSIVVMVIVGMPRTIRLIRFGPPAALQINREARVLYNSDEVENDNDD